MEYSNFCHGIEFNLDKYMGLSYKKPIIDSGEKKIKRRIIKRKKPANLESIEVEVDSVLVEEESSEPLSTK